jgi:hypothetical protein
MGWFYRIFRCVVAPICAVVLVVTFGLVSVLLPKDVVNLGGFFGDFARSILGYGYQASAQGSLGFDISSVSPSSGTSAGGNNVTLSGTSLPYSSSDDYARDINGDGTSDLVMMMDGINNTGNGDLRHDSSATTWKDLSGHGNDMSLSSGTTFTDDSVHGDGTGGIYTTNAIDLSKYDHLLFEINWSQDRISQGGPLIELSPWNNSGGANSATTIGGFYVWNNVDGCNTYKGSTPNIEASGFFNPGQPAVGGARTDLPSIGIPNDTARHTFTYTNSLVTDPNGFNVFVDGQAQTLYQTTCQSSPASTTALQNGSDQMEMHHKIILM